jgi:DNA-binding CsgD family transcriptional regulator
MNNVSGARKEQIQARRSRVLEMRIAGLSMRAIASQVDVSYQTVKNDLDAMYKLITEHQTATMEHLRVIELERLDKMQTAVWTDAIAGNVSAIDRILAISERRAKLLGLNVPIRTLNLNVEVLSDEELDAELKRYGLGT